MKKKLAALLLVGGVFAVSAFQLPGDYSSNSGDSILSVVKGTVSNTDSDRYWDCVTFGLEGLGVNEYKIITVEVFDKNGTWIGQVRKVKSTSRDKNLSWYLADLDDLNIRKDFYLIVHVLTNSVFTSEGYGSLALDKGLLDAPIDPDETVLIVKYP